MAVCACTLALGACGGGDDAPAGIIAIGDTDGPGDGSVPAVSESLEQAPGSDRGSLRYGQVVVSETYDDQNGATSRVAARFVRLTAEAAARTPLLERAADTCSRVPDDAPVPGHYEGPVTAYGGELSVFDDLVAEDLDAGQAIVLSGPDGTWSTLLPVTFGALRVYLQDSAGSRIDGRIPSGLMIDIPDGGDFPGFAAIELPDPQPAADSFVPLVDSRVDVGTVYRWAQSNATGSRAHLSIRDADGRLDCFAADDGLFTLAEAGLDEGALSGAATLAGVAREATRIERRDGATLVMTTATQRP